MPAVRERIRHFGGKMLDTRTRLQAAMPAERRASSNEVSFSRCLPTPLVKNSSFGTKLITSRSFCAGLCTSALTQTIWTRRGASRAFVGGADLAHRDVD